MKIVLGGGLIGGTIGSIAYIIKDGPSEISTLIMLWFLAIFFGLYIIVEATNEKRN